MTVQQELHAAGLGVFPCRADKAPAIPAGSDWRNCRSMDPDSIAWPTTLVGVAVPTGLVVIDLDIYKGVTREKVEALLGCSLPWDAAMLQTTLNGGEHYGFRCDWPARQGSNLHGLEGFDTRVGNKGYICTGLPHYTPNGFGVFRLARCKSLPSLPEQARLLMEHVEATPLPRTAPPPELDTVVDALRTIPPDCSRSDWVKVGMALRTVTDDVSLFDRWSSGELGGRDTPHNYVPEHIEWQWGTFKPDGAVQVASLFYTAIQAGWRPPPSLDTAAAFGMTATGGDTRPDQLIQLILEFGCDPASTEDLVRQCGGNPVMLALLQRELKDAGLLSTPVRKALDQAAGGQVHHTPGEYGKNHTENATLFLSRRYPQGGLRFSDETWYEYDGKAWTERSNGHIMHVLTGDMLASIPQSSTITGTYALVAGLCHWSDHSVNQVGNHLILFQNGVLDLHTGLLGPHSPEYFTTNILPYDYDPTAVAPQWQAFLYETLEGDQERIALLQEWFGYMLSNSTIHHKILFMIGPARSGKGLIGRILEQIVGPYNFTGCSLTQFSSDSFLESLRTKTVAFSGDTGKQLNRQNVDLVVEHLKKISGGDALSFSRKYKANISQSLPTRITIAANNIPNVYDDSGALSGRMLLLPFRLCYEGREDHLLGDRLLTELAGIATWALEGLRRLSAARVFTQSALGQAEARAMAENLSPVMPFMSDHCRFTGDPDDRVGCTVLYKAYKNWCLQESEVPMHRRAFVSAFKDASRRYGCVYGAHRLEGVKQRGFAGMALHNPPEAGLAAVRSVG